MDIFQEDNVPLCSLENVTEGIFVLDSCCLLVPKEELQHSIINEQEMQPWGRNQTIYLPFQETAVYLKIYTMSTFPDPDMS